MKKILVIVCVISFLGCVHSSFKDTVTDPGGRVTCTEYHTISSAWPMGKVDTTSHNMVCQFGNAKIGVGQNAAGMDNTGQVELIKMMQSLITVVGPLLATGLATKATTPTTSLTTPNIQKDLSDLITMINALGLSTVTK